MFRTVLAILALSAGAAVAEAHLPDPAMTASVADAAGNDLGTVTITPTPSGVTLVTLSLQGLPPGGTHGMHIHETGDCSAGDFSSAGGHLAGDREHGYMVEGGPHPGDMPNALVQEDGVLAVEVFNSRIDVEEHLRDEDGAAFIIHEGADDYFSQPSGNAGERFACAVLNLEPE